MAKDVPTLQDVPMETRSEPGNETVEVHAPSPTLDTHAKNRLRFRQFDMLRAGVIEVFPVSGFR